MSVNQGEVFFLDPSLFEILSEFSGCETIFGEDKYS